MSRKHVCLLLGSCQGSCCYGRQRACPVLGDAGTSLRASASPLFRAPHLQEEQGSRQHLQPLVRFVFRAQGNRYVGFGNTPPPQKKEDDFLNNAMSSLYSVRTCGPCRASPMGRPGLRARRAVGGSVAVLEHVLLALL